MSNNNRSKRKNNEPNSLDGAHPSRSSRRDAGSSQWKTWLINALKVLVILVLTLVLVVVAYGAKLLSSADKAIDKAYTPVKRETTINQNIDPIKDPISILILGIDDNEDRQIGVARTDAILLATVNPTTGKISMVSIPRDTYTQINSPNFVGKDKINSAYAYGEVEATIDAVENLMNVPINYYLTLDFKAFEDIVDAVDGVEIDVKFDYLEQNAKSEFVIQLERGRHLLNGEQTLAYARTRKVDDDIMRGSRQQEVMQAVLAKAMKLGSIPKFQNLISAVDGHFWTNMDMDAMLKIVESGLKTTYSFDSYIFSWMSFDYPTGDGISNMVGLHQDSLDYISHRMRFNLGLDQADQRDEPGYVFESNGVVAPSTFPQDGLAIVNN